MKNYLKVIGISLAIILGIATACRITGILNYFSIATPANEPTLKKKSIVFGSNLRTPNRFDFIFYKHETPEFGKGIWVHRLCGLPGDIIQLVNGQLLVNGKNTEPIFKTYHNYIISSSDFDKVNEELKFTEEQAFFKSKDSVMLPLTKQIIKDYKINVSPFYLEDNTQEIFKTYNKSWTPDNFGPYIVPNNSYFVIGDNRSNSLDSRYFGCIKKEDVVAVKL